jgi:hypothetical protein
LAVDVLLTQASGTAEHEAGLKTVHRARKRNRTGRLTLGADKNYDTTDFVKGCRDLMSPLTLPRASGNGSKRSSESPQVFRRLGGLDLRDRVGFALTMVVEAVDPAEKVPRRGVRCPTTGDEREGLGSR